MREQLRLLEELQRVDSTLTGTEEALQALGKNVQTIKADVARVEEILQGERRQLEEVQQYRGAREADVREEADRLNKAKGKLAQVRTSKEYLAVQREFEANRKYAAERGDEMSKLGTAIEQFQGSIAQHEQELADLKQHVDQEEAAAAKKMAELEAVLAEKRGARDQVAATITPAVLRKYDAIRKRKGGPALVPVVAGICTGCNTKIPPQLYNTIQRAETIEQCPRCQRILFYPHERTTPATDDAAGGGAPTPTPDSL